jgi:protein involved in polysaccharide export with SLBB domain
MMSSIIGTQTRELAACVLLLGASVINRADAQAANVRPATQSGVTKQFESRAQLERDASAAEASGRASQAWLLRSRLQKGDFQEGDRIVVVMDASPRPDTLQVRAPRVLQFPGIDDLSLDGVLRSELTDAIRRHLARYFRNPEVKATPLVPLAILGSVASPGYYYTAADAVLRDVIMRAGGLQTAALDKTVVRRAGEVIWNSSDVRTALADGISVDQLHLRAGDEIFIPERRRTSAATILTATSATAALLVTIIQLGRR